MSQPRARTSTVTQRAWTRHTATQDSRQSQSHSGPGLSHSTAGLDRHTVTQWAWTLSSHTVTQWAWTVSSHNHSHTAGLDYQQSQSTLAAAAHRLQCRDGRDRARFRPSGEFPGTTAGPRDAPRSPAPSVRLTGQ